MFRKIRFWIPGVLVAAMVCLFSGAGTLQASWQQWEGMPTRSHPFWWAQISFTQPHNVPWGESVFQKLAQSGMNGVEINMDWTALEPRKGRYDFHILDRYLAEAAKAHLKIYFLFWESRGPGCPPPWLTARDISSDGVKASEPPWWGAASRKAYFDYVAHTIDHVNNNPGFGGVYPAYGWLDSEWGPMPKGSHGVTGYAPADIKAFYRWLPRTYKTIANFNRLWHTSYKSWSDVPVGRPGDPMFALYQRFRQYSAEEGFGAVTRLVREHTKHTLIFSWGGGIDGKIGPTVQGNGPDMFFRLAKKYHVIVNFDCSNAAGIAMVFSGLGRHYHVPMINEWTPWRPPDLRPEIPQWLAHIGLFAPYEVGEDFFIYPPPARKFGFADGWKAYCKWRPTLTKVIQGVAPVQPVAVIVPLRKISLSTNLNAYPNLKADLAHFWRRYHVLPDYISDDLVARKTVSLDHYRAVVDLGNEVSSLPELKSYARNHPVLKTLAEAVPYLHPYVTVTPRHDHLEVVPTVEGSTVWLAVANRSLHPYAGTVSFDPAAFKLHSAPSYSLTNARTGQTVASNRNARGDIAWSVDMRQGGLEILKLNLGHAAAK